MSELSAHDLKRLLTTLFEDGVRIGSRNANIETSANLKDIELAVQSLHNQFSNIGLSSLGIDRALRNTKTARENINKKVLESGESHFGEADPVATVVDYIAVLHGADYNLIHPRYRSILKDAITSEKGVVKLRSLRGRFGYNTDKEAMLLMRHMREMCLIGDDGVVTDLGIKCCGLEKEAAKMPALPVAVAEAAAPKKAKHESRFGTVIRIMAYLNDGPKSREDIKRDLGLRGNNFSSLIWYMREHDKLTEEKDDLVYITDAGRELLKKHDPREAAGRGAEAAAPKKTGRGSRSDDKLKVMRAISEAGYVTFEDVSRLVGNEKKGRYLNNLLYWMSAKDGLIKRGEGDGRYVFTDNGREFYNSSGLTSSDSSDTMTDVPESTRVTEEAIVTPDRMVESATKQPADPMADNAKYQYLLEQRLEEANSGKKKAIRADKGMPFDERLKEYYKERVFNIADDSQADAVSSLIVAGREVLVLRMLGSKPGDKELYLLQKLYGFAKGMPSSSRRDSFYDAVESIARYVGTTNRRQKYISTLRDCARISTGMFENYCHELSNAGNDARITAIMGFCSTWVGRNASTAAR